MTLRILITFIISLVLLAGCSVNRNNYDPNKKYSRETLQADYTLLKNILEKKHPSLYWYTGKDSMDLYFEKYYSDIKDSMTELQFGWKILAPLTDKIHCGHTSFGMSRAYNRWVKNIRLPSFPLLMKVWNDTMVVTANINRRDTILKRGTFITGINGIRNAPLINYLFNFMTEDGRANNINYLRLSSNFPYYHRNVMGLRKMYTVQYLDSTGIEKNIELPLYDPPRDSARRPRAERTVPDKRSGKERRQARLMSARSLAIDTLNNTAVMTVNTFSSGRLRRFFRQSFRYLEKTGVNSLVLDIRSNGGGKINLSTLLTKYISRRPFKVADSSYAVTKFLGPYTRHIRGKFFNNIGLLFLTRKKADGKYHFGHWEKKLYKPKKKYHYNGDVYVLINGPTFSAASLFSNAVKGQPGIILAGEETGGGWHGNNGIMIPDITLPNTKLRVRLPLFRLVQYKHVPKNGLGVVPDVYIPTSYDALIKGYDKKMQVVMDLIKNKQPQSNN